MANRLENSKVASRYARALFDSTVASGDVTQVADSLKSLSETLAQVPEFTTFIENPVIPVAEKIRFTEQQLSASLNPWIARLLSLLLENNRMLVLPQVVEHFSELLRQRENVAQAEILTAGELELELRSRIQKALEASFGFARVELQHRVDPGLLGGVVVKIQDRVIDGSYRGRLDDLRKQITHT